MTRDQRFTGRAVVVTGGGSGIGRVMSQRFAAEGAAVVVADIVEETAARDGRRRSRRTAAGRSRSGRTSPMRPTVDADGRGGRPARSAPVDVLVNNAYSCKGDNVLRMDEEIWDRDLRGRRDERVPLLAARAAAG